MILVSNIINRLKAELDSDGNDRYDFPRDFNPAINKAIEWSVALFNSAFGQTKLGEEVLRELIFTNVYVCNGHSRLNLYAEKVQADATFDTNYIWSILSVIPEPRTNGSPPLTEDDDFKSFLTDFVLLPDPSNKSAERKTLEEWENIDTNMFAKGSAQVTNGFKTYSYINFKTSKAFDAGFTRFDQSLSTGPEIEIKPVISNKFVAVNYLRYPDEITSETDTILYPSSLTNMITQKALDFITRKNYDRNALYEVNQREIQTLVTLMS